MEEHTPRKPWYRPRNIFLLVLLMLTAFLGAQVYRALTATPGHSVDYGQKLTELAWSVKPGATEADNAAPLFTKAMSLRDRAIDEMLAAHPECTRGDLDFTLVGAKFDPANPGAAGRAMDTREDFDKRCAFAVELIGIYRRAGVFDVLAEAATKSVNVRPKMEGRLIDILLPDLGACRDFARANRARMRLASQGADQRDYAPALEQTLGLARLCTAEPVLISNLVGVAISTLATNELRRALLAGELKPETLREVAAAMDRQGTLHPISLGLRGEHVFALDIIQWTHTDDGNGDGRRIVTESMGLSNLSGNPERKPATRLVNLAAVFYPSKKQMIAKTDELYMKMVQQAELPVQERRKSSWSAGGFLDKLPWNYDVLKLIVPAMSRAISSADLAASELAGVRVWVAIEQYRAEHGGLPASLDELVPAYLPHMPVDPFAADGRIRYRPLSAPDALGRTYLVYSVGADGNDDGGNEQVGANVPPGQPAPLQSTDLVINRVETTGR